MLPPIIEFLKDKSVLILGFGREGKSTYNYIRRYLPEKKLTVADGKEQNIDDENVAVVCGENYLDCLGGFDVVIKSPGILGFFLRKIFGGLKKGYEPDFFRKIVRYQKGAEHEPRGV